jgi:hypothetical protein
MALTRQSVTANKYMMAATWSTEAMEDARAKLNLDLEAEMVQALSVEIGRELFATILTDIVQGATGGNCDHRGAWRDERAGLSLPVAPAALRRRGSGLLEAQPSHGHDPRRCGSGDQHLAAGSVPQRSRGRLHDGGTRRHPSGRLQGQVAGLHDQLPAPEPRPRLQEADRLAAQGYVYMPYVPLSPMPLVYAGYNAGTGNYQNTDEWTRNIRTRAGRLLTVGDEYAILTQG